MRCLKKKHGKLHGKKKGKNSEATKGEPRYSEGPLYTIFFLMQLEGWLHINLPLGWSDSSIICSVRFQMRLQLLNLLRHHVHFPYKPAVGT